jgi:peptidoglycan/xylan/chitin deacetylase (PgdA/CDA1 family)
MPDATLLVRERDLGDHGAPGPRHLPPPDRLLRWGRPVLAPLSSAMRVATDDRIIALTYDDGPHPEHTPQILGELDGRGVRATFFVLAEKAERHPELIRRMLDDGHEIGLHGIDHARLTDLPARTAARAVRTGRRRLEAVTGRPVRLYRPTYGAQGMAQFLTARALGMDVVYWTAWARDWLEDTAEAVAGRAVRARHPGAIVLLHDVTEDTMDGGGAGAPPTFSRGAVTAAVLAGLLDDGYEILPAGELMARYPIVRAVTMQRPWRGLRRALPDRLNRGSGRRR